MKKYAVAVINFYDNDLKIEIIHAESPVRALAKHSYISPESQSFFNDVPDPDGQVSEVLKQAAFDIDMMVDVVEITNEEET